MVGFSLKRILNFLLACDIIWIYPPPSNSGFPTKNVIILVVTVTGWGVDLRYNPCMTSAKISVASPSRRQFYGPFLGQAFNLPGTRNKEFQMGWKW